MRGFVLQPSLLLSLWDAVLLWFAPLLWDVSVKLKNLREKGIIERVGSDRKGYWNIYL